MLVHNIREGLGSTRGLFGPSETLTKLTPHSALLIGKIFGISGGVLEGEGLKVAISTCIKGINK